MKLSHSLMAIHINPANLVEAFRGMWAYKISHGSMRKGTYSPKVVKHVLLGSKIFVFLYSKLMQNKYKHSAVLFKR